VVDEGQALEHRRVVFLHHRYPGFPSGILDPALTGGKRGHVIVQLSRPVELGDGLVVPVLQIQDDAQIAVGESEFRIELNGCAVFRHRLVELASALKDKTETVMWIGGFRVEPDRDAIFDDGIVEFALVLQDVAKARYVDRRISGPA
jgi:hypothetical protein